MSDQISNSTSPLPPPLPKKRSWRWFKILVGTILGLMAFGKILLSFNTPDLELTRLGYLTNDDGHALEVVNVGRSPTTISNITVNDRPDCPLDRGPTAQSPAVLNIGDKRTYVTSCRIIRASVQTDHGSGTYTFSR